MEQAAFEPNNMVPGTGLSPDKMLLARDFSYADAHRARLGVNYKQIPVNAAKVEVHSYSKDGAMRVKNVSDPVYAPNSKGAPKANPSRTAEPLWHVDCQTQNYLRIVQRYLRMVENFAMLHYSLLQRAPPENHCVLTQLRWPLRSNCCPAVQFDDGADRSLLDLRGACSRAERVPLALGELR
jgi:hypothetical protein